MRVCFFVLDKGEVPVLPRGYHTFPFSFPLPESSLPCSYESKTGTIRYYVKVSDYRSESKTYIETYTS